MPAVIVRAHDQPAVGAAVTRADGRFDLVVNGGGDVVLDFRREGHPPVQRSVELAWHEQASVGDVVLVPYDSQVTTIALAGATTMQVARGSAQTDGDGTRRATLLFPPGTSATLEFPGGGTEPIDTLHVRATEYTVGPRGPAAMPGELPPTTAYTYAVELSVDEAVAAAARTVRFDRPVPYYLENFLDVPVGTVIPVGYFDAEQRRWVAAPNGRAIRLLSVSGSLAELDLDGTGAPASASALAALGITDLERETLASLYTVGQELWRVPLDHLTPEDYNFAPWNPSAQAPQRPPARDGDDGKKNKDSCSDGSIIECTNQILGESLGIAGSPFTLSYRSDRVPGRKAAFDLEVPLTGAQLPPGVLRVEAQVNVAGQEATTSAPPNANQTFNFSWDGLDAYGRKPQGRQPFTARVGYVYPSSYGTSPDDCEPEPCFGRVSTGALSLGRGEVTLYQNHFGFLGAWDAKQGFGLGGWSLSAHHAYDPQSQMVYYGYGGRRKATGARVITSVIGNGQSGYGVSEVPASQAPIGRPAGTAPQPDGTVYVTSNRFCQVHRVDPAGILHFVAGAPCPAGPNTGNGPWVEGVTPENVIFGSPTDVAIGPADGLVYILDRIGAADEFGQWGGGRVVRIDPDGRVRTVLHRHAELRDMVFGPDGYLYVAEKWSTPNNVYIERVDVRSLEKQTVLDGFIDVEADDRWTLIFGRRGEPDPSPQYHVLYSSLGRLAFGPDGRLYFATESYAVSGIFVYDPQTDRAERLVGRIGYWLAPEGAIARDSGVNDIGGLLVLRDGSVLFSDWGNDIVHRISPEGFLTTIAGVRPDGASSQPFAGVGLSPRQTPLLTPGDLEVSPDGRLLISDMDNHLVRAMEPELPEDLLASAPNTQIEIPSEDGSTLFVFDGRGQHIVDERCRDQADPAHFWLCVVPRQGSAPHHDHRRLRQHHQGRAQRRRHADRHRRSPRSAHDAHGRSHQRLSLGGEQPCRGGGVAGDERRRPAHEAHRPAFGRAQPPLRRQGPARARRRAGRLRGRHHAQRDPVRG